MLDHLRRRAIHASVRLAVCTDLPAPAAALAPVVDNLDALLGATKIVDDNEVLTLHWQTAGGTMPIFPQ